MANSFPDSPYDLAPSAPPPLVSLRTWCRHCGSVLSTTGTVRSLARCPECLTDSTENCSVETNIPPSPEHKLTRLILLYQNKIKNYEHVNKYLLPKQI
mgnify:CR=1 FL=1